MHRFFRVYLHEKINIESEMFSRALPELTTTDGGAVLSLSCQRQRALSLLGMYGLWWLRIRVH